MEELNNTKAKKKLPKIIYESESESEVRGDIESEEEDVVIVKKKKGKKPSGGGSSAPPSAPIAKPSFRICY